jgi:hypothetical protein
MKIKIIVIVFCLVVSIVNAQDNLVPQNINITEFVGDILNPDRGFYTPGAGGIVPISDETLGGGSRAGLTRISGINTDVEVRISYASFNLRNFSGHSRVKGVTENAPISADGLAYYRRRLDSIRARDGVVLIQHDYDNKSWDVSKDELAFSPEPYGQCTVPGFGLRDCYLPTHDELMEIRTYVLNNPTDLVTKDMLGKTYWTSTDTINAWPVCIEIDANAYWQNTGRKFDAAHTYYVRPVRAF